MPSHKGPHKGSQSEPWGEWREGAGVRCGTKRRQYSPSPHGTTATLLDPDFADRLVQVFTGRDPRWMWVERRFERALWLETDGEGRQWLCQGVDWSSGALVSERECEAPSEGSEPSRSEAVRLELRDEGVVLDLFVDPNESNGYGQAALELRSPQTGARMVLAVDLPAGLEGQELPKLNRALLPVTLGDSCRAAAAVLEAVSGLMSRRSAALARVDLAQWAGALAEGRGELDS